MTETDRARPTRRTKLMATTVGLLLAAGGIGFEQAGASTSATAVASVTVPVTPFRILDTRLGIGTGGVTSAVAAGQSVSLQVAGVGTVPADATGVVLNITSNAATDPGYVTVWPTGQPRPEASVLNLAPGQDLPNMITAALGEGGRIDLYNFVGSVHLIADVAAYLLPAGSGGGSGPQGPQGPAGPRGFSAWDTIPSGVTVRGGYTHDTSATGSPSSDYLTIALPAVAPVPLSGGQVNFAPTGPATDDDPACTGSVSAPTAPAGKVCLYLAGASLNVTSLSGEAAVTLPDTSFLIRFQPTGAVGVDEFLYVSWAYTAP